MLFQISGILNKYAKIYKHIKYIPVCTYANHRIIEVGRDLWRSSGPNPLLKQGHAEPIAQDYVQIPFEYLR